MKYLKIDHIIFQYFLRLYDRFGKKKLKIDLFVPAKYDCYTNDMLYKMKKYRYKRI